MKTIGQIADFLEVKTHTVRYWVDNFPHIKLKIGKGDRRYFDVEAEEELLKVKNLIQKLGMSIDGVKSLVHYNKIKVEQMMQKKPKNANIPNLISKIDKIIQEVKSDILLLQAN